MQIDFVITELFVGGAERCLTELALGMADSGDKVRVFSIGSLPKDEQSGLVNRLREAGIEIASGEARTTLQAFTAYRRLKKWLTNSEADICQTFLHHANVLGTLAAKSAGLRNRVAGIRVAESRTLRCQLERYALRSARSVICVSTAVQEYAASQLGCPQSKLMVIPNAVDASHFINAPEFSWPKIGWPEDSVVTLFVGRLHQQKGLELLQAEIDRLAPSNSNRRLLLVGDGPQRDALQEWASRYGQNRVQLLGWRSDIAPLMASSRLVILPSRYEGMPNVILEAMAAGKPVVCSRIEGSRELLQHDWEEQTFPIGDSNRMAVLANRYLDDSSIAHETGAINQRFIQKHHVISAMVKQYRDHYRTMLKT